MALAVAALREILPRASGRQQAENKDVELLRHALRGAGYFRLTRYVDKIASFFNRDEPYDDLRDDALFAYALAMPGETTRGRVKGMLRKIDSHRDAVASGDGAGDVCARRTAAAARTGAGV